MERLNSRDVIIIMLCVVLCLGASTFFPPCGPKDDDSWMICHWAAQTVIGLGCVMIIISIIKIFMPRGIKQGLDISLIPLAAFTAYLPDNILMLCRVDGMRCHTIFQPSIILLSGLIIFAVIADIVLIKRESVR